MNDDEQKEHEKTVKELEYKIKEILAGKLLRSCCEALANLLLDAMSYAPDKTNVAKFLRKSLNKIIKQWESEDEQVGRL